MFFLTYLRRELRRRARQATFIALGLALGVGLVVTVAAASSGVKKAQGTVLASLYGVGTDVAVNGGDPGQPTVPAQPPAPVPGKTVNNLTPVYAAVKASKVTDVAGLHDVTSAVGVLSLSLQSITFHVGAPTLTSLAIDGVEPGHDALGPLSGATLTSGRMFTSADSDAPVAVVDANYAKSHSLHVGSAIPIDGDTFTVIGIVSQAQQVGGTPTDVYLPLAQAQTLSTTGYGPQTNDVNTIYLTAASAADVTAVHKEITALLPGAAVTTQSSLASEVTGSLSTASRLVNELGKWLSILVLIAAFALACLLTMAAVNRRARELGTLKAIGWRSRRVISQVLGESVAVGIGGALAGVGLGYAGVAIIAALAPSLPATVPVNTGNSVGHVQSASAGSSLGGNTTTRVLHVPLHASVSVEALILAVALAIFGGLLAGVFASWRIARLQPVDALAQVA